MQTFTASELKEAWSHGTIILNNMCVQRMSYGTYFLEPSSWNGTERDKFAPGTKWLKFNSDKQVYEMDEDKNEWMKTRTIVKSSTY